MASVDPLIDLDVLPEEFALAWDEIIIDEKHNSDLAGNLVGPLPTSFIARKLTAEWANFVDDFIREAQDAKLRWARWGSGVPDYAAPIGTLHTDTDTGIIYSNTTGADDGWVAVGGDLSSLGVSSFAQTLLDDANAGAFLTTLGVSSFVQTLLDDANAAAFRSSIGLGSAAIASSGDFEAAGAVATHAAVTSGVHGITSFTATLLDDTTAGAFMTTLGISSFAQTILDDTTAGAVLTTLGVSSFVQTLLDDTTAANFRTTLGAAANGDVTASGLTMATARLLGRTSASAGAVEEISVDSSLSLAAGVLSVAIAGVSRWITSRTIDFNAWPDTDFAAGGNTTYSLNDGTGAVTWTADGTANANDNGGVTANCGFFRKNAADVGSDGASGLRIAHDTGTSTTFTGTPGGASGAPRLSALLSDLVSDFDPFSEYRILIHITRLTDRSTAPINAGIHVGVAVASGVPAGSASVRLATAAMQRNGANEGGPAVNSSTGSALKITDSAYAFTNGAAGGQPNNVIALTIRPGNIATAFAAGPYSSGWPADSAFKSAGTVITSALSTTATIDLMSAGLYVTIGADSRSSSVGCVDFMVRRLAVQRRSR